MGSSSTFAHAALTVFVALTACRPARPASPSPVQLLFERALTLRDTTALAQAIAPKVVFHARGDSTVLTRDQVLLMAQPILSAFPDIRFRVEDEVRSADKIAARVTFTGTHRGPWRGIQPTGRSVRVSEMFFCRVVREQLAECWQEWDEAGLFQQLSK